VIKNKYKNKYKIQLSFKSENGKECIISGRIRLNGDNKDHINIIENTLVSSLDVKLKDNINTFNDFKLLLPHTRKANSEIFISTILNHFNLLSPKVNFIELEMFKKKNNYLFYENINKEFLERNKRIEGPIIRGDERFYFTDKRIVFARLENSQWIKENEKNQLIRSIEAITLANRIFIKTMLKGDINRNVYALFDYNLIKNHINFEEIKKYRLLINAFGANNSITINDIRLYYDPVFKKFDIIYNDGSTTFLKIPHKIIYTHLNVEEIDAIDETISKVDKLNQKKLREDLIDKGLKLSSEEVSNNIVKLKDRLNVIKKNKSKIKNIPNDVEFFNKEIDKIFKNTGLLYSYYLKDDIFEFCQNSKCRREILELKDIKKLLNQKFLKDKKKVIFLGYKDNNKKISNFFDKSKWSLKKILDTKIYYSKDSKIEIDNNTINFFAKKNSKIIFTEGVLKNKNINYINEDIIIANKSSSLNGCINFYDIKVSKLKIKTRNSLCEDAINFVRTEGDIDEIISYNSISDAIDFDFSNLKVKKILVKKSLNDCLDFSFGNYIIENVEVYECGDKGFSIGENSYVKINKSYSSKSNINIAIKDKSNVFINNMNSSKTNYCIAMYRKKSEFVGSELTVLNNKCENKKNLIDPGNIYNSNVF
jgi:hypothetical protein